VLNSFRHKCTFNVEFPFEHDPADKTSKPILVSVEKAINKFAQDESISSMCIRVQYIKTKKKASIWYVKLRKSKDKKDDPLSQDQTVCGCCGTFPYISTIYQFFDTKLFDGFFAAGKRDTDKLLKTMKAYDDHIHHKLSPLKHHMKHLGEKSNQKSPNAAEESDLENSSEESGEAEKSAYQEEQKEDKGDTSEEADSSEQENEGTK